MFITFIEEESVPTPPPLIAAGSPPAFPILDASLMASAAAASVAGGDASPPTAAAGGAPSDPNATTPQKYSCARCGRSYLHQATLVRHQVRDYSNETANQETEKTFRI